MEIGKVIWPSDYDVDLIFWVGYARIGDILQKWSWYLVV